MAENKTKETDASVEAYLEAIEDETRRQDCRTLIEMMGKAANAEPKMWGSSIVGFGTHHYKYESGREGDTCEIGFSSRKPDLTLYSLTGSDAAEALLAELGKHTRGKGCLYIRRLSDIKTDVLAQMVALAVDKHRRDHP